MLHHFHASAGIFSHYARLLCDTVIPFQEAVLRDEIEGVAPSHAVANFANAAALLTGNGRENDGFFGMVFQDSDVAKWIEDGNKQLINLLMNIQSFPGG